MNYTDQATVNAEDIVVWCEIFSSSITIPVEDVECHPQSCSEFGWVAFEL